MPQPKTTLPDGFDHGFTTREGGAAGIRRGRTRGADLETPFRGVRWPADVALDLAQRCDLLQRRLGAPVFVSHATAARLWGLPVPARFEKDDRVHLSCPAPARAPHSRSVFGHALDLADEDVVRHDGLWITSPPRTWLDLASLRVGTDSLVIAGDRILRWTEPLADRDELEAVVRRHSGARGVRYLRQALTEITDRSQSERESRLRIVMRDAGLPRPLLNHVVTDRSGKFVARVDMAFPEQKVLVEYEGAHHRSDAAQWAKDLARFNALQALGWICVRVEKEQLRDPLTVVATIAAALASRA